MVQVNLNDVANEFKEYIINKCRQNLRFISSIKFNKKSISININDYKSLIFNDFFTEKSLYNTIISYLSLFIKENNINCFNTVDIVYDIDYLKYVYKNLRINEKVI